MTKHYDIIVIGGGAGGLFFTTLTADKHKKLKIAIIEKNQRVGKKLLVTGNGRCNLTNIYADEGNYHGSVKSFMSNILNACPPQRVLEIFLKMGLVTRADDFGRVYPKSNQASSVLDVLRFNCERENVDFYCEYTAIKVEKQKSVFAVTTDKEAFTADKLIFATGGAAAPKAGGDKSGYELLKSLGHTIIKPSPALCPVGVKSEYLKSLKGLRVQGEVSLVESGKEIVAEEGEIQFTENALSGICVFNLSQYVEKDRNYFLRVKLLPEYDFKSIFEILLNNRNIYASFDAENLFTGIFHKRLAQALLKSSGISFGKKVRDINDKELKSLTGLINSFDFEVKTLSDFSNAQVTKGGVKGDEVDPRTFESKKIEGLYIIGEALDCNGDCGGYNLQFAFATGYLAAMGL